MVSSAPHATPVAGPAKAVVLPAWAVPAAVVAATVVGAVLRIVVAGQSLFGDELSTYWIVTTHDFPGSISFVANTIEITPPLYFALAWVFAQIDAAPELLRAPSLIAGTLAIPLVHAIGVRTIGRAGALVATALTALSPFMIFYSAEARGYMLMTVLVALAAFCALRAVEAPGRRWWIAYGACTCAAAYAHYTSVFGLAVLLGWLLWAHPGARRPALLATLGAVVAFLPWLPGFVDDLQMPDSRIMSDFSPLTWLTARLAIEHWSIGFPYITDATGLKSLPGGTGLGLLALALAAAFTGISSGLSGPGLRQRLDPRLVLVVAMALAAPLGEAAATLFGTNLLATRNLAVSWPWLALALGAFVAAAGPRMRVVAGVLLVASFALGAAKLVDTDFRRPDFAGAAAIIDREAGPDDGVIDAAVAFITPGPVTGLDATLDRPHETIRGGASQRRDGNFRLGDQVLDDDQVAAAAAARGGEVFVVYPEPATGSGTERWDPPLARLGYRRAQTTVLRGFVRLGVYRYAPGTAQG